MQAIFIPSRRVAHAILARMDEPVLLELLSLPEVRVGHYGSLMVMVWRGEVSVDSLAKTNAVEDALVKQFGKISVIGAITNLVGGIPSAELRKSGAEAMRRFQPHVRGTALVVMAEGAKAVLARTFLAGMALLIDFKSPMKTFRVMGDAVTWLNERGSELHNESVARAVELFVSQSRPPSR
jgi:hypothetical protein